MKKLPVLLFFVAINLQQIAFSSDNIGFKIKYNILEGLSLLLPFLTATTYEYYFGVNHEDTTSKFEDADTAIVLLHGKGVNKSQFIGLRNYLSVKFNLPVISFNLMRDKENKECWFYGRKNFSIKSVSETFVDLLKKWSEKTGIKKFIFIGHSLGGIIAMNVEQNYLSDLGLEAIAVIQVASPVKGSPAMEYLKTTSFGSFWLFKEDLCCKELRPESELLIELGKNIKNNDKYFHIVGFLDGIVPKDFAYFEQKEGHVSFHYNGHFYIILNPLVWFKIGNIIKSKL